MATLFTGSVAEPKGFALACQLDKGLGPEIDYMALRRDEDVRAAAALGIAPPVHLPFREAPHRGYGSAPELFSETRADDGIAADLAPAVAALIAADKPDLLLAPRRSAAMSITSRRSGAARPRPASPDPVVARLPLHGARGCAREPLADLFAELPEATVTLDPECQARKRAACAAYASQIGFQFGGVAGLDARLARETGTERFRRSRRGGPTIPGLDAG